MAKPTLLAAAALLAALDGCEAHVKLFFTPASMNIRNAASASGDGAFSTSGPCGGSNVLGANGFNTLADGQQVCARINYNGGHASVDNRFRATFTCGTALGTGAQSVMATPTPLTLTNVAGVSSPIEADGQKVNGAVENTQGFTLCVDLPKQNLAATVPETDPSRTCTLSVLDQRQWGGCLDIKIGSPPPTPPPTPIVPQTFSPAAAGTYKINSCDAESGGVCCLQGTLGVKDTGQVFGRLSAVTLSAFTGGTESAADAAICQAYQASINSNLKWEGDAAATFSAPTSVVSTKAAAGSQSFQLMARDPVANGLVLTNVATDAPIILNAVAVRTSAAVPEEPVEPVAGAGAWAAACTSGRCRSPGARPPGRPPTPGQCRRPRG